MLTSMHYRNFFLVILLCNILTYSFSEAFSFNIGRIIKQAKKTFRKLGQVIGVKESCSKKWIRTSRVDFEKILKSELLGQEIAHQEIPYIFNLHWENRLDSQHLLLCFYGSPGTGKTFTTKLVNKYIFTQGDRSYYYHFYTGSQSYLSQYGLKELEEEMKESIEEALYECPYSIIVFDEADIYPKGFLDSVVMPFIMKTHDPSSHSKKGTFVFLTNVGSDKLMERSLEIHNSYFKSNTLYNYEVVKSHLIKESQDSFFSSKIVQNDYISSFIPFLPHKQESFVKCLEKVLDHYGINQMSLKSDIIRNILCTVKFIPDHDPIYINHGCKQLESLIFKEMSSRKSLISKRDEL